MLVKNIKAKDFYTLMTQYKLKDHQHKWVPKWQTQYGEDLEWSNVYGFVLNATKYTAYRTLHYKIVTRIEITNVLLRKMGLENSSSCKRCHRQEETLVHKFWECRIVTRFWERVQAWLVHIGARSENESFTGQQVLLGLGENAFINHVIIVSKTVIRRQTELRLERVIQMLKRDEQSERVMAVIEEGQNMQRSDDKWVYLREEMRNSGDTSHGA